MTTFEYDVVVIGAGHAGCEAATAAARMGARTVIITMDMNKIAQMSCNPAVGGIAKGQIVREIDALGGQMGRVTDATTIQFRMLNRSKGPAMWSPRAQCDRRRFIEEWRQRLENTEHLDIWQDEAAEILTDSHGNVCGVSTVWGATFRCRCAIVTAGTFLNGLMHVGRRKLPGGRCSEPAATLLSASIAARGITLQRMKTGTPVRIDARSVHFEDMEEQPGDDALGNAPHFRFSYTSPLRQLPQLPCWTCSTNAEVHRILRGGLADSPLYNGQIQSIGPRYCPSIETKLVTFAERDSHPLFLEPEGLGTNELYLNGFSSSLPMDVQISALKAIPCFRDVKVFRPGYAIEYDFFDPTELHHTLESKKVDGLFMAGQVNGTTGYEEAAGQGIVAGINAALKCGAAGSDTGTPTFTLGRDEAYIGVLIDDLVIKGVDEPYRMFTSRAEYRILLRQDNADARLTPHAIRLGMADEERKARFHRKQKAIETLLHTARTRNVSPREMNGFLEQHGSPALTHGCKLSEIIARPGISLHGVIAHIPELQAVLRDLFPTLPGDVTKYAANGSDGAANRLGGAEEPKNSAAKSENSAAEFENSAALSVDSAALSEKAAALPENLSEEADRTDRTETVEAAEILLKYDGYISRERASADKMQRLEHIRIRDRFDYADIHALSTEARQKLAKINPETLAQASRIPGVSPSDISVLLVLLGR